MDATGSVVSTRSGAGSKRNKQAAELLQRLASQQAAVVSREKELVELKSLLEEQEREFSRLSRETGARKQRVNVNTLKGAPPVKQVGLEMANAIRRRQQRRKEVLRDKVNKLTAKLGEKLAVNRELKADIDHRRRARLHHIAAMKDGCSTVEQSQAEISELIVAAQRA